MNVRRINMRAVRVIGVLVLIALLSSGANFVAAVSGPVIKKPMVVKVDYQRLEEQHAIAAAESKVKIVLPKATTAPQPAPPSVVFSTPLKSHEIFGFAPYWTLYEESQFNVSDFTTIDYFGVSVNGDATLSNSDSGWSGFQSQDLVDLINRAHAASDRVVLTISCLEQSTLVQLVSNPNAPTLIANEVIPVLQEKHLDGLNIDFEGQGSAIRSGLTRLIVSLSTLVHAFNPNFQVTVDTYASSAGDPNGPFNIGALSPGVDGFFVMGYDMENPLVPSPNAALDNWTPSDVEALQEYTDIVPPTKLILGIPYYGYDWQTTDGTANALATAPPIPLTYQTIVQNNNPQYWDPTTSTPWTSYEIGTQWHETYYDDPASVALKAALADYYHVAGVGVWALGMDGNDQAMLAALLGNSPPIKDYNIGPVQTSESVTSSTTTQVCSTTTLQSSTTSTSVPTTVNSSTTTSTTTTSTTTTVPTTTSTTTTVPTTTSITTTAPLNKSSTTISTLGLSTSSTSVTSASSTTTTSPCGATH